jgi:hypothetical protein
MLSLACFLFLAASRVQLADEVYEIPASEWRYVDLALRQRPAMVMAYFDVTAGPPKLRLALLRREDLEKLRAGAPHSVIDVTGESAHGALQYPVREPGDYALVIDNQGRAPASVHIRVWLDFARHGPVVTQLSPRRQLGVIAISFLVFFGIVSYSAHRLLRTMRR